MLWRNLEKYAVFRSRSHNWQASTKFVCNSFFSFFGNEPSPEHSSDSANEALNSLWESNISKDVKHINKYILLDTKIMNNIKQILVNNAILTKKCKQ